MTIAQFKHYIRAWTRTTEQQALDEQDVQAFNLDAGIETIIIQKDGGA